MIDMNRTTQKVQEALQEAQAHALRLGHAEIDGEHLLLALCEQQDGLAPRLLQKLEIPVADVITELKQNLQARPSVGGPELIVANSTPAAASAICCYKPKLKQNNLKTNTSVSNIFYWQW